MPCDWRETWPAWDGQPHRRRGPGLYPTQGDSPPRRPPSGPPRRTRGAPSRAISPARPLARLRYHHPGRPRPLHPRGPGRGPQPPDPVGADLVTAPASARRRAPRPGRRRRLDVAPGRLPPRQHLLRRRRRRPHFTTRRVNNTRRATTQPVLDARVRKGRTRLIRHRRNVEAGACGRAAAILAPPTHDGPRGSSARPYWQP